MVTLFNLVKTHGWSGLREIQNWDPMKNAVIAYAIMGSPSCGMVVVEMNPIELFQANELYMVERLGEGELSSTTFAEPPLEWKPL